MVATAMKIQRRNTAAAAAAPRFPVAIENLTRIAQLGGWDVQTWNAGDWPKGEVRLGLTKHEVESEASEITVHCAPQGADGLMEVSWWWCVGRQNYDSRNGMGKLAAFEDWHPSIALGSLVSRLLMNAKDVHLSTPASAKWWKDFPATPVSHRPTNPDVWRRRLESHIREAKGSLDRNSREAQKVREFESELLDAFYVYQRNEDTDRTRQFLLLVNTIASRACIYLQSLDGVDFGHAIDSLRFDLAGLTEVLDDPKDSNVQS